jgi:WD40 repeat protein
MCISVWDYQAAGASEFLVKLVGHSWCITTAAFLGGPRKYQFVTTSEDGTIRIWDLDRLLKGTLSEEEKRIVLWSNAPITVSSGYERGSWIKNADGEILFYLPQDCPFRNPLNTHVLGECVELDMTNFVYGTEWTKCRELSPAIESVMQRNDHDGGN